jgi:hypothetical protein
MHHELFSTHELCGDVFVSDTDPDQSLRDMLADGALVQVARRSGVTVELFAMNASDNPIVLGFADICNSFTAAETYDELLAKLGKTSGEKDTLRLVVIPNAPLILPSDTDDTKSMAAKSSVQQAVAITDALDCAKRIADASIDASNCFFFHYGARTSRNGLWELSTSVSAILPKSRVALPTPANINIMPTLVLGLFAEVDTQDNDLYHHEGVAVTIDEEEDGSSIRCICRLIVEDERYTVTRLLPPNSVSSLSKAFLSIEDPSEWIIRDNQGIEDNLADSVEWLATAMPSRVISACLPAVRDVSRRRAPMLVDIVPPLIPAANPPPPVEVADSPVPSASASPPPAATPPSTVAESIPDSLNGTSLPVPHPSPIDHLPESNLLKVVEDTFGKQAVVPVADTLKTLDDQPYTLILGADNMVQVLPGALPPRLLDHLSSVSRTASLPLLSGNTTQLNKNRGTLQIGRVLLDLKNVVRHERIIVYRSAEESHKPTEVKRTRIDVKKAVKGDSYRGSVPRFARKIEIARSLMHR